MKNLKKYLSIAIALVIVTMAMAANVLAAPRLADPQIAICDVGVREDAAEHHFAAIGMDLRGNRLYSSTAQLCAGTELSVPLTLTLSGYRLLGSNAFTNSEKQWLDFPALSDDGTLSGVMPDGDLIVVVVYSSPRGALSDMPPEPIVMVGELPTE